MGDAVKKLEVVKDWIDFKKDDSNYELRHAFIKGVVFSGASSLDRLMGVVYLAQFEDLRGEFAQRPILKPDFQVLDIPWSRELLGWVNKIYHGGAGMLKDHRILFLRTENPSVGCYLGLYGENAAGVFNSNSNSDRDYKKNLDAEVAHLLKKGGQLGRLYTAVEATLQQHPLNEGEMASSSGEEKRDSLLWRVKGTVCEQRQIRQNLKWIKE